MSLSERPEACGTAPALSVALSLRVFFSILLIGYTTYHLKCVSGSGIYEYPPLLNGYSVLFAEIVYLSFDFLSGFSAETGMECVLTYLIERGLLFCISQGHTSTSIPFTVMSPSTQIVIIRRPSTRFTSTRSDLSGSTLMVTFSVSISKRF